MVTATGFLIVAPRRNRYSWPPNRVFGARIAAFRKTRPNVLKDGQVAVEVTVQMPASAFTPKALAVVQW
jgi:hypothetical protein